MIWLLGIVLLVIFGLACVYLGLWLAVWLMVEIFGGHE